MTVAPPESIPELAKSLLSPSSLTPEQINAATPQQRQELVDFAKRISADGRAALDNGIRRSWEALKRMPGEASAAATAMLAELRRKIETDDTTALDVAAYGTNRAMDAGKFAADQITQAGQTTVELTGEGLKNVGEGMSNLDSREGWIQSGKGVAQVAAIPVAGYLGWRLVRGSWQSAREQGSIGFFKRAGRYLKAIGLTALVATGLGWAINKGRSVYEQYKHPAQSQPSPSDIVTPPASPAASSDTVVSNDTPAPPPLA